MGITGGFGFTFDTKAGVTRNWYLGRDGVQRWADNDQPCDTPLTAVNAQFDRMFSDIPQPVTLEEAAQEAVGGLFGETDTGYGDG